MSTKIKPQAGRLPNVHPGKILLHEFLEPLRLTQTQLAKSSGIAVSRINDLIKERRAITPDSAIRLGKVFGISEQFWINLQGDYDVEEALLARAEDYAMVKPLRTTKAA